jgi:hypothetical protein
MYPGTNSLGDWVDHRAVLDKEARELDKEAREKSDCILLQKGLQSVQNLCNSVHMKLIAGRTSKFFLQNSSKLTFNYALIFGILSSLQIFY